MTDIRFQDTLSQVGFRGIKISLLLRCMFRLDTRKILKTPGLELGTFRFIRYNFRVRPNEDLSAVRLQFFLILKRNSRWSGFDRFGSGFYPAELPGFPQKRDFYPIRGPIPNFTTRPHGRTVAFMNA